MVLKIFSFRFLKHWIAVKMWARAKVIEVGSYGVRVNRNLETITDSV